MASVRPDYVHIDKVCAPCAPALIGDLPLKWYNIGAADKPVPGAVEKLARDFLAAQTRRDGDLGFVVLHRCGHGDFYFLLVQTWLGDNEIWKTTYSKDREDSDFRLFPLDDPHKGTFCVWEAGAVWHEVGAWKRYLRSPRDEAAKRAYLADAYEGVV